MKKFNNGDIFYNSIKAHPKVKIFVNSGIAIYNNNKDLAGNAVLFDFLRTPISQEIIEECFILAENSEPILTELLQNLLLEDCTTVTVESFLLTEAEQPTLTESSENILVEQV
jgi:hypothetical protein